MHVTISWQFTYILLNLDLILILSLIYILKNRFVIRFERRNGRGIDMEYWLVRNI